MAGVGVSRLPVHTSEMRKKMRMYNILADSACRSAGSLLKIMPNVFGGILQVLLSFLDEWASGS